MAQTVKHLPAVQETWVHPPGWEDPLEKEMATHSSTLAWKIPWMGEPGRLQSMGPQRVRHDWATSLGSLLDYTLKLMKDLLWMLWVLYISLNRVDVLCYSRPLSVLELQLLSFGWPFQLQLSCFILGWAAWSLPTLLWFSCQRCGEGYTQNLERPISGSLLLEILPSS